MKLALKLVHTSSFSPMLFMSHVMQIMALVHVAAPLSCISCDGIKTPTTKTRILPHLTTKSQPAKQQAR
jgi:hypothetical protein